MWSSGQANLTACAGRKRPTNETGTVEFSRHLSSVVGAENTDRYDPRLRFSYIQVESVDRCLLVMRRNGYFANLLSVDGRYGQLIDIVWDRWLFVSSVAAALGCSRSMPDIND